MIKEIQEVIKDTQPRWKYAAMDFDGLWSLFEEKPLLRDKEGIWVSSIGGWMPIGKIYYINRFDGDWKDSLTQTD